MTPELIGRQETTNQKRRLELTLDLINARVTMSGFQRNQIREILREQFSNAIEEEREVCIKICDDLERHYREDRAQFDDSGGLSMYSADAAQRCAFAIRQRARSQAQIEKTYQEHATMNVKRPPFVTNLDDLRKLWGDEAVDKGLADGTIRILDTDEESQAQGDGEKGE